MPDSEYPKQVINNDLPNSQFAGGLINAESVKAGRIGGDIYNTKNIHITNYYYREDIRVASVQTASDTSTDEKLPCPYRGLFHFSPDDAEYFFGREVFIEELFTATKTQNFIPVLGASGSGKSSVVLAGLVPKLQQEGHWLFTHFRPGSEPFYALAQALVPLYEPEKNVTEQLYQARQLAEYLVNDSVPLKDVFQRIERNYANHRVLLIADQFEELYTLCSDEKIRRSFLDTLLAGFQSKEDHFSSPPVLVSTMRVDFLGNALAYPPFADVLRNADIKIRSMNRSELSEVITKPAQKLEVTFEPGLIERILDDVDSEPGNLPLLEFALTLLWEKRTDKQLTHAAYEAIGEVQGALASHADTIYKNLNAAQQQQVSRIFMQLVRPGEGTEDTRRVATKAELGEENWSLVQHLADKRLVVTSCNADDQETVEVAHEALIRHWGKLQQWMNADRSFRAWQERLRSVMYQWEQTQRDEGALLRGAALAEAEEKLKDRPEELIAEKAFIEDSIQERNRLEQEKADRRQRDVMTAWRITGGSLLAVIISAGLWLRAGYQQRQAELNLADSLVRNSLSLFAEHKELEAFVDAIKAGKILQKHKETNPEVINSLIKFVYEGSEYNRLEGHDSGIFSISFSPKGKILASLSSDGIIKLWNRKTGKEIHTLKGHNGNVKSISFSPDGKILASGGYNKNILLWDVETGKKIGILKGYNESFTSVSFSPDGKILAVAGYGYGENIQLWDVETREEISTLKGHNETVSSLSFSRLNGKMILAAAGDKNIHLWDIKTKEKILTLKGNYEYPGNYRSPGDYRSVNFSPDGKILASGGYDKNILLWDVETGKEIGTLKGHSQTVSSLSFSPDGKILASGGYDKNILLWDVETGKEIGTLKGHSQTVSSLSFSPDGKILASGSNGDESIEQPQGEIFIPSSGKIKLWNVEIEKATKTIDKTPGTFISFISDGRALAVDLNKRIQVWDVGTGEQIKIISNLDIYAGHRVFNFSPDGRLLASANFNKYIQLKDLKTRKQIISLSGKYLHQAYSFSFSYDNKLLASAGGSSVGYIKGTSGYVNLWNIDTKEEIWTDINFSHPIANTSFSPNGRFLTFISNQYINLLDIKTKKLIKKKIEGISLTTVSNTSFSPSGKILALLNSSYPQATIVLLDVENGRKIATFNVKGPQLSVNFPPRGLSFSPDGKILAFGKPYFVQFWSLDLDSLINRTCDRVRNYLHYNPDVKEEDRNLCDGIGDQK